MAKYSVVVPAIVEWLNTGIQVRVGQHLKITATGTVSWVNGVGGQPLPNAPTNTIFGPNGGTAGGDNLIYPFKPFCKLVGRIGSSTLLEIGSSYDEPAAADGVLYLAMNDVAGGFGDNYGQFQVSVSQILESPPHDGGEPECPITNTANGEPRGGSPLSLRTGEKFEDVVDLNLVTPAGLLEFKRSFRQSKLDDYQIMGAGWWHNHALWIDTSVSGKLVVWMPEGGQAFFNQVDSSDIYAGDYGSTALIDAGGSGSSKYTLQASDQSTYVFDEEGRIRSRSWATGETWTYTYYDDPHFAEGLLKEVTDGYGRALQFAYTDNSGQYNHKQLWRVGDQTVPDLETGSPSGRYVEFVYLQSRLDGTLTSPDVQPLLHRVKDVHTADTSDPAKLWEYTYYGQESGEDDEAQTSWLIGVTSPTVDLDGDGEPDQRIVLKALEYTLDTSVITEIVQQQGKVAAAPFLRTTLYEFQPDAENVTHETVAGRTIIHRFSGGVYLGPENAAGNQTDQERLPNYRLQSQQDANGNLTALEWNDSGSQLNKVIDALQNETVFTYDSLNRLMVNTDAQGRQTLYSYDANTDQPALVLTALAGAEIDINGGMEEDSGWGAVSSATHNQSDTQVDTGAFAWYVDAASGDGIESNNWSIVSGRTYVVRARVFPVNGGDQVRMTTDEADFNVISAGDGDWETLYATFTATANGTRSLRFLAEDGAAEFYVDSVHLVELEDLLLWQSFQYDSQGRTQLEQQLYANGSVSVLRETRRTYHTTGDGNGLLESLTQVDLEDAGNNQSTSYTYDSAGRIIKTQKSSLFGSCDIAFTVYDAAGNVVASICNYAPGMSPDPTTAEEAAALYNPAEPEKNRVTTHRYDELGRRVATTTNAGADFAQTTLTLFDALDRPWRVITNYVNPLVSEDPDEYAYTPPGTWVWDETNGRWQDGDDTSIAHGDDRNQNLTADTTYNARGLTRMQRDTLGSVTLHGYDDADRLVKTVQHASDPDYDNEYDSGDPDLSSYVEDTAAADVDIITEQAYDPAGNRIKTVNPLGIANLTAYDALNRPVEVVSSASDPAYDLVTEGDFSEYDFSDVPDLDLRSTTSYDALGRVVETGQLLTQAGAAETWVYTRHVYDALGRLRLMVRNYIDQGEDPSLWVWDETDARWERSNGTPIAHGEHNDQNLISEQVYDEAGRLRFSRDMMGTKTWQVYDGLDRQVKQIAGCTYTAGSPAPEDNEYVGDVDDPAADIISETFFDVDGRAVKTRRLLRYAAGEPELVWVWTLTGYDTGGRQVRVVQNASDPDYDLSADPDLSAYEPSANPDADIITETAYDAQGRVYKITDALGNVTLYGFDTGGRQVKIIQNASDPDYDVTTDPALSAYTPGAEPDEDFISQTRYDISGRAVKTTDTLGSVALYGYDGAGRRVKVIQNASDPDYDTLDDPDLSAYTPGVEPDEDLITETAYDKAGRTVSTTDTLGSITLYGYDRAGRQVKVIQNASDPDYDVTADPDLSSYAGDDPDDDQDRITQAAYDKAGRTVSTTDAGGNITLNGYDLVGRVVKMVRNASDPDYDLAADPDLSGYIGDNPDDDQDRISEAAYDLAGRAVSETDAGGVVTRYVVDRLGRRTRMVAGYLAQGVTDSADWLWNSTHRRWEDGAGTAVDHDTGRDRNRISDTTYDKAGRITASRDARGTLTTFTADGLGRRVAVTEAVGTHLETVSYTCYDKAGRVERFIHNWQDTGVSPDAKDGNGDWLFNPTQHGSYNDRDLITLYQHDLAGRRTAVTDPVGNTAAKTYFRDGQVDTETDPEGTVILFRYDGLRRRILVVQGYTANSEDPFEWVWDDGNTRYEESDGTPIEHGAASDQNIIVQVTYDKGGRMTSLSDPRGSLTEYEYDRLGRRTKLTNPLNDDWLTAYEVLVGGKTRVTTTYPGLTSGGAYNVQRDFDRLGRPAEIDYGAADVTPRVTFAYDPAGSRASMREYDSSEQIRKTSYDYDTARRLTQVAFDTDGDDDPDETVSYEYDLNGSRTKLTLPGNLSISYRYDAHGRLVGLTDWDEQASDFFYDHAGRHVGTQRANGMLSDYLYNPAGHLRRIRHFVGSLSSLRAHFEFQVDGRGNRTQAFERIAEPTTISDTYDKDADEVDYTAGTWTDEGDFKKSEQFSAKMTVTWTGDEGLLTMGTGPDHSIFDIYIGGSLWQSYDGYTADPGERVIHLPADALLEIRNRATKNIQSTGYVIRFKQLDVVAVTYDERTIQYTYDALSRLTEANYNSGAEILTYGFDLAGNMTNLNGASRTYNAANQLVNDGTNNLTYDDNGNMTSDGTNSYVWDRANRLLSMGGISYTYNGDGNRIQQDALQYILDLQPGLAHVIGDSDGNQYIHSPRGIHAVSDGAAWTYPLTDALGSVRGYVGANTAVLSNVNYTPIGVPDVAWDGWAFTGEWRSENETQYHQARHLSPGLGVWLSLDPFEGVVGRPMSLNGYAWVEGQFPNATDASGMCVDKSLCLQYAPPSWRCNCLELCTPAPTCDELAAFNCTELWATRGCQPFTTPTSAITIFFGGSWGGTTPGTSITDPGPEPRCQTGIWTDIADLPLRYPGSKADHVRMAIGYENTDVFVIGYSAGADSALMFADKYLADKAIANTSGQITGVLLLGATLSGTMPSERGGGSLTDRWQEIVSSLISNRIPVYVYDDAGANPPWNFSSPSELYQYDSNSTEHIDWQDYVSRCHTHFEATGEILPRPDQAFAIGTNSSERIRDSLLSWFVQFGVLP
jgi:RHS repeat-associated protein